jgi:hypothetical protein
MNTLKNSSFSSVLSVNPYNNSYATGTSGFLNTNKSPHFDKSQLAISYLNTKGYINSHIEISKNIPDEDLYDAINVKIYDELALDQTIEYQIQYIEIFNIQDNENRHFHIFIADPSTISETYESVVDKVKYLDIIIPTPLLIKSLYTKEIIQESGVHCFIYFEEEDSFITIYNEQEFVYTKSLKFSLLQMHEKFCEIYGEKIEYDEFIKNLFKNNLKDEQNNYKNYILKLYREIFSNINEILTYAKRAFDIEKIEHVYIGSQIASSSILDEIAEVELSIRTSGFDFDYGFENSEHVDTLHTLMQLYTTIEEDERYECNFTIFHRPPNFVQRQSGKLIILTAASFIIAFAYPVTYWTLTYIQELQYNSLQTEYSKVHKIKVQRETTIKNKQVDKAKFLALLAQEKDDYTDKKNTLIKIHEVKVNYPMKAKLLDILTKDLNKYDVNVDSIAYDENDKSKKFTLNLISTKDKIITKLLEFLTKKYERKFDFSLEKISFDKDSQKYLSELKVIIL